MMRLCELFEDLSPTDIKGIELRLNRAVYMPPNAVQAGGPVLKLNLPTNQHFGGRAQGDSSGRLSHENTDFTPAEVQNLLLKARTDPSLGYAQDLVKFASFPGPGDYPPDGHGYQLKDPKNNLLIPVVVKPNPRGKKLMSKTTVMTDNGIEPRNILKAKTIMFYRPRKGEEQPQDDRYAKPGARVQPQRPPFSRPAPNPYAVASRRPRPSMADYDDEST
jgi:hypothetical protein